MRTDFRGSRESRGDTSSGLGVLYGAGQTLSFAGDGTVGTGLRALIKARRKGGQWSKQT